MNRTVSTWIVGGTVLASAAALAGAAPLASPRGPWMQEDAGGLVRLDPVPQGEAPHGLRLDGGQDDPFAADQWTSKLTDADLDRREEHFDELVGIARRSAAARRWLEERAADTSDPGLAWTARLVLREAGAKARFLERMHPGLRGLRTPGMNHLQQGLRNLLGGDPFGFSPMLPPPGPPQSGRISTRSQGVQIQTGPDGVKVTITETVDGEESSKTYEADDLDALLEAHPELRGKLHGTERKFELRFDDSLFGPKGFYGTNPLELFEHRAPRIPAPGRGESVPTDVLGVYIEPLTDAEAELRGLDPGNGLLVHGREPGTIAHVLGIGAGDVLLSINGVPMDGRERVSEVLDARPPDGELAVVWLDSDGIEQRRTWAPAPPRNGD
jgi:hypothetical protein